jgi:hypothetical protein
MAPSDANTTGPSGDVIGPRSSGTGANRLLAVFGLLLLLDFLLVAVMLATDKNLQTNFGQASPYYSHWYGALLMGVVDLLAGLALLANSTSMPMPRMTPRLRMMLARAGLAWTILVIVASVGIVATYQQVGFQSAGDFAHYLFDSPPVSGGTTYIPWLYDALLAMYVVTAIVGVLAVVRTRAGPSGSTGGGASA